MTSVDASTVQTDRHPAEVVADFLEHNHWIQKLYSDGQGGYCILGAMNACDIPLVSNRDAVRERLRRWQLAQGISVASGKWSPNIVTFNDKPNRTKEEVLAALRYTGV